MHPLVQNPTVLEEPVSPTLSTNVNFGGPMALGPALPLIPCRCTFGESCLVLNCPSMQAELMKKSEEIVPMLKLPLSRDRSWQLRPKVGWVISGNFPREIVLKFLITHPCSLIILQLVDKNLLAVLRDNHAHWIMIAIYKKHFYYKAFMNRQVCDQLYPCLNCTRRLSGAAAPHRPLPWDSELDRDGLDPWMVSDYVQLWYALLHGIRYGMCGRQYRHEVYWSLQMLVCQLCWRRTARARSSCTNSMGCNTRAC